MNYGYFLKITGSELDYNDVLLGILFILSVVMIAKKQEFSRRLVKSAFLFLAIIILGMLYCYISPAEVNVIDFNHSWDLYLRGRTGQMLTVSFSSHGILMCFRVVIFVLVALTAYTLLDTSRWIETASNVLSKFK